MKLLKPFCCALAVVSVSLASCLGLNYFFGLFNCGNGIGTSVASWITICIGAMFVGYLFYPDQVADLIPRYFKKKVEDQFGAESQGSQERISRLMNKRIDDDCVQDAQNGVVIIENRVKKTNLQCLGDEFKTIGDLVRAIREEGRGRACLAKVMSLCSDANMSPKNRVGFRGLMEMIYEISGGMFVTESDFKTRIKNADEMLRYCDANSQANWPYRDLEDLASQSLIQVIFGAYRNDHIDVALDSYNVLASRRKWLERVKPEKLSFMYELLGLIWATRDLRRSSSYLKIAVEYDFRNSLALYCLARLYFHEKHDYAQALEYANQSFAHLPENMPEGIVRGIMTIQYFCHALKSDYWRAREIISNIDKELSDSELVGNKAYLNFKCGDYLIAENLAAKALKMNPEEGSALNTMGMLLLHRGQYVQAIRHFKSALKTFKKGKCGSDGRYFYCELCNNCAVAYYENHDEESAKEWFDKALDAGCLNVDMRRYDVLAKKTDLTPLQKKC